MSDKQHTVKSSIKISGTGLHTGKKVNMTFNPAPEDTGFVFRRTDLPGKPEVKADVDLVIDISRGTTLEKNGVRIATVEHTLAALVGMSLDNVYIDLDAEEPPIMDGSSKVFVDAISKAGIAKQKKDRKYFEIKENIFYAEPDRHVEIVAMPANEFQLTVMIDFDSPALGSQHAKMDNIHEFGENFANSRTFCFLHELEQLYDNNLIRGGDFNNALVIVDRVVEKKELDRLKKMFNKKRVVVKHNGIVNNKKLRYYNEPARHKLLDVIGDLALVGMPLKGKIIASRPGHAANIEFARKLKTIIKKSRHQVDVPEYRTDMPSLFDVNSIAEMLPHRYPMLLVDKIVKMSEKEIVGVKNVTYNEQFFQGHFPGNPIMPGVLQIEALAQTGGILAMNNLDNPQDYVTYFLKIEKARFKNPVVPGDTLILKMELLSPVRRGICEMKATAFVGNKIATEAELVAQLRKKAGSK